MEYTAEKIAAFLGGTVDGDKDVLIQTVSKIEEGFAGSLSFLANPKYTRYIYTTEASAVIVNNDFKPDAPLNTTLIRVEDAYKSFARLLEFYEQNNQQKSGISEKAFVSPSAELGSDCFVGHFAVIGDNVKIGNNVRICSNVVLAENVEIGDDTVVYPNVTVYKLCKIGQNCIIHAGAVIGSDGFGFAPEEGAEFKKIPQAGNVVIEDNVEIGANCAVDRATIGSTVIGSGVKLDNLIQIAHNVEIGKNTVIASQTGISGSTKVGRNNMIGGQVGFAGHLKTADNVKIGAQSGIHKDIEQKGAVMQGSPVTSMREFYRSALMFSRLPQMQKRLNDLEQKIEKLMQQKQV